MHVFSRFHYILESEMSSSRCVISTENQSICRGVVRRSILNSPYMYISTQALHFFVHTGNFIMYALGPFSQNQFPFLLATSL